MRINGLWCGGSDFGLTSFCRHKTRLHIGQLVKDTSAKLKQASENDQHTEVSVSADEFGVSSGSLVFDVFVLEISYHCSSENSYGSVWMFLKISNFKTGLSNLNLTNFWLKIVFLRIRL